MHFLVQQVPSVIDVAGIPSAVRAPRQPHSPLLAIVAATMDLFCNIARDGSAATSLVQYGVISEVIVRRINWQQRPVDDSMVGLPTSSLSFLLP